MVPKDTTELQRDDDLKRQDQELFVDPLFIMCFLSKYMGIINGINKNYRT